MTADRLRSIVARVATIGCALMAVIVVSSAYLRLSTTGFGCDGWPSCYGQLRRTAPSSAGAPAAEATLGATVARTAHRVSAMAAGVVVALLLTLSLLHGARTAANLVISALLVVLTVFLATLGRYTTGSLLPGVSVANLLGGHAMLALLWSMRLANTAPLTVPAAPERRVRILGIAAICAIVLEVFAGGVVSARFATAGCGDVVACWPKVDALAVFGRALDLSSPLVLDGAGRVVAGEDAAAAHALHRGGGLVTAAVVICFAFGVGHIHGRWRLAGAMVGLVGLQAMLGWGFALRQFPLLVALAHSTGAVVLLLAVIAAMVAPRSRVRGTTLAA